MQKVLIITYYWPPAGGPGVQRWLKFVKYLRDFNIEPVLYVPKNPHYPMTDESFLNEVPEGIKIYRHPIFEPYGLASIFSSKKTAQISAGIITTKNQTTIEKALLWVRGNLFIPDARKFWVKPSVKFLSEVLQKENIATIITTGPPHSVHLIGHGLKKRHSVKWLADFRDPWTSIGYHQKLKLSRASRKKHEHLENLVLNSADKILVTSNTTKKEFSVITNKPIEVITNGYDTLEDVNIPLDKTFTISHIGSLLSGRNPASLWKALAELIKENASFKERFKLQLAGVVSADVLKSVYGAGLKPYTELLGYVSHEDALRFQKKSQVLLLVEIDSEETKGIIPGKVFEYMAAKRPILGIGPKAWEVGQIIAKTHTGNTFEYQEKELIKKQLLEWFMAYKTKELILPAATIGQFHRRELTRKLSKFLQWE
ncbi:hypothetical protein SAMN04487911_10554 [Arenibacter nanhaiticus]|uniref:Glycosyl transferase family 1 n=1 Tax=Arenibacter nanhaiticus TaxID=558155 RepID=A0A1M6DLR8_9FLAO|nr:glycosyltransferase family 4 protein [Arenibacter nanhaiticus]SHI73938.1 hypothetical protein SAMN04487911_10554 [Arenibacter nanhaiticus]